MLLLNILSVLGDPQNNFAFVMQFVGEFRIIKRGVGLEQCAFGLHEDDRFIGYIVAQFFCMGYIISPYTENFHCSIRFKD
jgi:hypothetical protein